MQYQVYPLEVKREIGNFEILFTLPSNVFGMIVSNLNFDHRMLATCILYIYVCVCLSVCVWPLNTEMQNQNKSLLSSLKSRLITGSRDHRLEHHNMQPYVSSSCNQINDTAYASSGNAANMDVASINRKL
jgi:hypothetical protein